MSSQTASMIVVTGVDGILRCVETGSCREALAALRWLATYDVPVVMTSYRPAADLLRLQTELSIRHPFICDGGASLFVPRQYFAPMRALGVQLSDWERVDFDAENGDARPALEFLLSLYRLLRGDHLLVIGCGSSACDMAVLELSDVPIVIRGGTDQEPLLRSYPSAYVTEAAGPAGWSEAILGATAA